jgi:hypothetical protein
MEARQALRDLLADVSLVARAYGAKGLALSSGDGMPAADAVAVAATWHQAAVPAHEVEAWLALQADLALGVPASPQTQAALRASKHMHGGIAPQPSFDSTIASVVEAPWSASQHAHGVAQRRRQVAWVLGGLEGWESDELDAIRRHFEGREPFGATVAPVTLSADMSGMSLKPSAASAAPDFEVMEESGVDKKKKKSKKTAVKK